MNEVPEARRALETRGVRRRAGRSRRRCRRSETGTNRWCPRQFKVVVSLAIAPLVTPSSLLETLPSLTSPCSRPLAACVARAYDRSSTPSAPIASQPLSAQAVRSSAIGRLSCTTGHGLRAATCLPKTTTCPHATRFHTASRARGRVLPISSGFSRLSTI